MFAWVFSLLLTMAGLMLFAGWSSLLFAQDLTVSAVLSVVPRICVLAEKEGRCNETVTLEWSADKAVSLCLYQNTESTAAKCWQNATGGMLKLELSADETVVFQLRDYQDDLVVLASAEFKVMKDKKKYRRSRRNPWSFF